MYKKVLSFFAMFALVAVAFAALMLAINPVKGGNQGATDQVSLARFRFAASRLGKAWIWCSIPATVNFCMRMAPWSIAWPTVQGQVEVP